MAALLPGGDADKSKRGGLRLVKPEQARVEAGEVGLRPAISAVPSRDRATLADLRLGSGRGVWFDAGALALLAESRLAGGLLTPCGSAIEAAVSIAEP